MMEHFARLPDNAFFPKVIVESADKRSKMSGGEENKVNLLYFK